MQLLEWANEESTVKSRFNNSLIKTDEHNKWFARAIENNDILHLIGSIDKNNKIGQIRFERWKYNEATIDITIAKQWRGRGLGTKLLEMGVQSVKENWPEIIVFRSEIKMSNTASQKLFEKGGFMKCEVVKEKEYEVWKLET